MGKKYEVAYTLRIELEKTTSVHANSEKEACEFVKKKASDYFDTLYDDLNLARITVEDEMVTDEA